MITVVLEGDPIRGIPDESKVHVVELPDLNVVWEGVSSGPTSVSLGLGKYRYGVVKHSDDHQDDIKFVGEFLAGVTEQQWSKLRHMRPKLLAPRMTHRGEAWGCKAGGCTKVCYSRIDALEHEAGHHGTSLLEQLTVEKAAPVPPSAPEEKPSFGQRLKEAAQDLLSPDA